MTLDIKTYVRNPLDVDGVEVTEENFSQVAEWCGGRIARIDGQPVDSVEDQFVAHHYIQVDVQNPKDVRQTQAKLGDWVLYTERGGFKVYTRKAFYGNFKPKNPEPNQDQLALQGT